MTTAAIQSVTILGSTGSIGQNTLDVIRRHTRRYSVFALTANTSVSALFDQCKEFKPRVVVMRDEKSAADLSARLCNEGCKTEVLTGAAGLCEVASRSEVDIVMAAIVGAAGLESSMAAATSGKKLLLANKESLVMSGALFTRACEENGATLLPIDSEHNAIYQCLANGAKGFAEGIRKILLTGSGGPLLRTPIPELVDVSVAQACRHPNFSMGRKISVDSATMMNKGLELIEARWLFNVPLSGIEIVIHPQQIIHSMVEYVDGSVVAQMGNPDMRTPIAHGLAWPERVSSGVDSLDLLTMGRFDFEPVDRQRFPCVELAEAAAEGAGSLSISLN
ncbi:MAG: 1-deoxy-D-xylulose-5-phosphate reductoisomerase, partial [bacterium]